MPEPSVQNAELRSASEVRSGERFLVTGALGCIGAWVCRQLLAEGVQVVAYDLGADLHRLELVLAAGQLERITFLRGDVTDLRQVEATLAEHRITHVVHLAALQVPFCRADPALGAHVNVVGTVNVFEAVRQAGLASTIAYASSAAVYDAQATLAPGTIYGVYKRATEQMAELYAAERGLATTGLRPHTVFGPGRDQGLTSAPTKAMLAAAAGLPYAIPYTGRAQFQYAPDVASAFVQAVTAPASGARGALPDLLRRPHAVPLRSRRGRRLRAGRALGTRRGGRLQPRRRCPRHGRPGRGDPHRRASRGDHLRGGVAALP